MEFREINIFNFPGKRPVDFGVFYTLLLVLIYKTKNYYKLWVLYDYELGVLHNAL